MKQLALPLGSVRTWGGKRSGAGRKPRSGARPGVPHRPRPHHRGPHPVHVTLRARGGLPPLREQALHGAIRDAIRAASRSQKIGRGFRVVHYSLQRDHVHLIVEATNGTLLSRGVQGLTVRVARAINRVLCGQRGGVFPDRFHSRELRSPREVRNALVYVLMNFRKHARRVAPPEAVDGYSSAPWFDGFLHVVGPPPAEESPVVTAETWLAKTGWRRRGLIGVDEAPRPGR